MPNGKIVFNTSTGLYLMDGDGTNITALVSDVGNPHLSPDGTRIIYVQVDATPVPLKVFNLLDNSVETLIADSGIYSPYPIDVVDWAPDGVHIVFYSVGGFDFNGDTYDYGSTYVMNIDNGTITQISNSIHPESLAWSSLGNKIAFHESGLMYTMNPDGSGIAYIGGEHGVRPVWSPDDSQIACFWVGSSGPDEGIHVMDADGSNRQLIRSSGLDPSWSPYGNQIAFVDFVGLNQNIYVMDVDGSNVTLLTAGERLDWGIDYLNPPNHDGASFCPICYIGNDEVSTPYSISLRSGEKRETITDLMVNTPAGPLAFTRSYRQGKQGEYQSMGLGWIHNHEIAIDDSVTGKLIVHMPNGGQAHFTQVGSSDQYVGDPGSNSVIHVDTGSTTARYTLTASDQSIYIFDDQKRLRSRQWPQSEEWTYAYFTSGFASGKLQAVEDGYGRKLQFAYVDNASQYDHLQLWRVGDHDTTDLDDESLVDGRYIEFHYTDEKLDGSSVTSAKALLHEVDDVRGNTWTYRYYGQESGEDDSELANFLVEVVSPLVDTDGDGMTDDNIVLKHLTYTLTNGKVSGILQERGFIDGDNPNTALSRTEYTFLGDETTEEVVGTGLVTTHHFGGGIFSGSQDPDGNSASSTIDFSHYRPTSQADANGNATDLEWSGNGKRLEKVTDALSHETGFTYDSEDRLVASLDAEGRRTLYAYESANAPRQPSLVLVTDGSNLVTNGDMEADSDWTSVGTPTTNEQSDVQVDSGDYARYVDGDAGEGIQSANWTMQADHTYLILARVFPVNSGDQVKMRVAGMTEFDVLSQGDGAWETLRAVHTPTSGGTKQLQFLAESTTAAFYVDTVFILEDTHILRWQAFTYDSLGRTLTEQLIDPADGVTPLQEVERVYYTSGNGNGLLQKVSQIDGVNDPYTEYTYDSAGRVTQVKTGSAFGECCFTLTEYDAAGNIIEVTQVRDPLQASVPEQSPVTTHHYDALGRRVQTTTDVGTSFEQAHVTLYDSLDRVVRTITNFVDDSYDPPANWVFEGGVWKDGPSGTTISHGTGNTDNLVADTAYNARGLVRLQRDVLGNVTLLGYNAAGRLIKTVQNASDDDYNNDYIGTSPDPDLSEYTPVSDADQDIITEQVYDPNGSLVQSIDALSSNHFTIYDALNRPVKTVRSAKDNATIALNPGDMGYDAANDPRSDSYEPSADPDRDLIQTTEYDSMGRVIRSQHLLENRGGAAVWDTTLYGYDSLGRQIKTVRSTSNANYDLAADPDLSAYTPSGEPDEDLITQTAYDDNGRALYTQDVLDVRTWLGYDGLGRQVKTIASAVGTATDGGSSDPRSSSYTPSSDADEDLITHTVYNSDGRVQETEDVLGYVTYFVYDSLGRQVRTITNFVDDSYDPPADWVFEGSVWKDGPSGTTISHGADNDENIIAETVYDAEGRVSSTFDHRHNETRYAYDVLGRRVETIQNYGDGTFSAGTPDEDLITTTEYDVAGRVIATTDNAGIETRFAYDLLGRRVKTIQNYGDGTFSAGTPDEDLISETVYNKAGQVIESIDARGTVTGFTYDAAGRRLTVVRAQGTALETVDYTGYDKAGRVLRTIQNWVDDGTAPDAQDGSGNWLFAPTMHGLHEDANRITAYAYDAAGRRFTITDPVGNVSATTYFKDGQVNTTTDPEAIDTAYRYDKVRRRTRVVQGFVDNGEDPALWVWDGVTDDRWEESDGTAIAHGTDKDQNVIVDVAYDKAGRMLSLRDPRGNETTYAYDKLARRLGLTNPLSITWETAYSDLSSGGTRATQTMPGINGGSAYTVQRDFDRLGRLSSIQYGAPAVTPDVAFGYDAAGNRARMTEYSGAGFTSPARETLYGYDDARRLISVGFDVDANSSVDETVSYAYDAGGLRTKLTLPGSLEVVYTYNVKGELVALTDWDDQETRFAYDNAGRHIATQRANGLRSRYRYDAASQLRQLRHIAGRRVLGHFAYTVDGRGNRVQALEALPYPATTSDVTIPWDDDGIVYRGDWTDDAINGFKETASFSAALQLWFLGRVASLTFGVGPDHGIFDVYIGKTLWESFDGYAASAGTRTVDIPLDAAGGNLLAHDGPHLLEIRNRPERNTASSGFVVRFKQLLIPDVGFDIHAIRYTYDNLSRLIEADYDSGSNVYTYGYDLAGNLVDMDGTTRTFNAANQMTHDGANTLTYDNNGNLTADGMNSYTWDHANRLTTFAFSDGGLNHFYTSVYNGLGQRIHQYDLVIAGQLAWRALDEKYLLDVQPTLATVLRKDNYNVLGALDQVTHYVHGPRGIHAQQDNSGDWFYPLQDGLGSVRGVADTTLAVQGMQHYAPYGTPFGAQGSLGMPFGFTGEQTDETGLVYLRARYLSPELGVFASRDPFEGTAQRPMSMNGYMYVEGDPVNFVDPDGNCPQNPWWNDLPGQRCIWLANELSRQYNIPLDVLMQKDWAELEYLYGLGNFNNTLSNAAILPNLFYQNPLAAWQSLQMFLSGCNNGSTLLSGAVLTRNPAVLLPLGAIGAVLGIFAVAGVLTGQSEVVLDPVWYQWLHPFENPYNTPQPGIDLFLDPNPQSTPAPTATPTRTVVRSYRGLDGNLHSSGTYFSRPVLSPSQFRVDPDGVSTFETIDMPGNKPYAMCFEIDAVTPYSEGDTFQTSNVRSCTATYTPSLAGGLRHWSVNCNVPEGARQYLSDFAKGNRQVLTLNPNWAGSPSERLLP